MTDPPATGRLPVLESWRVLEIVRGGRLQPWLGPALRGLAGGWLKARTCRQPAAEQRRGGRWERCRGCPLATGCAYGETVEGDGGAGCDSRPLVVGAAYPCPPVARVGDRVPVRAVFLGDRAAAHAATFWDALHAGGADPAGGLGGDGVRFEVLSAAGADRAEVATLPAPDAPPGFAPRVRVTLTGPLILEPWVGAERRLIERPALADLLGRWRTLDGLFRGYGEPLPAGLAERAAQLAAGVPTRSADFRVVGQPKRSHRTGDRWDVCGVVGWAEYGPVPVGLLPWVRLTGRVHVGTHRVAGAGGWETDVPARRGASGDEVVGE